MINKNKNLLIILIKQFIKFLTLKLKKEKKQDINKVLPPYD